MQRADVKDRPAPAKAAKRRQAGSPQAAKQRQERARKTGARIAQAAIAVLAKQGLSRVTHRSVATEAGVSLAATTDDYATKADIIRAASAALLQHYVDSFERTAER